ncbi:MAG TPA: hypothetical protein VND40_06095 [Nitrososphaerales archaeon]|nr:hypothetical protein [Nitrososphaerales archaeon]
MTNATRRTAIAALGVLAIALAAGAVAFLPVQQQAGTRNVSQVTAVVTSSGNNVTFTQGPGTAVSAPVCGGSTETYANITWTVSPCVSFGFPSASLKNATLASRQVLQFIKTAYEYHLAYFAFSRTDANVMYAVLNVTGSQVVTGNWTTGYQVSYVGDKLLNVTVLQVVHSHFQVTHVSAYALPDRSESVAYTPQQLQAISVALSDPKVRSLMVEPPYYVEFVGSSGNATTTDSYFIQLYQVDGTGIVGAFVNPGLGSVVTSYTQQRVSGECWPDGMVITDPWGETGFSGCPA